MFLQPQTMRQHPYGHLTHYLLITHFFVTTFIVSQIVLFRNRNPAESARFSNSYSETALADIPSADARMLHGTI